MCRLQNIQLYSKRKQGNLQLEGSVQSEKQRLAALMGVKVFPTLQRSLEIHCWSMHSLLFWVWSVFRYRCILGQHWPAQKNFVLCCKNVHSVTTADRANTASVQNGSLIFWFLYALTPFSLSAHPPAQVHIHLHKQTHVNVLHCCRPKGVCQTGQSFTGSA